MTLQPLDAAPQGDGWAAQRTADGLSACSVRAGANSRTCRLSTTSAPAANPCNSHAPLPPPCRWIPQASDAGDSPCQYPAVGRGLRCKTNPPQPSRSIAFQKISCVPLTGHKIHVHIALALGADLAPIVAGVSRADQVIGVGRDIDPTDLT